VLVVALLLLTLRDWRGALVSFSAIPLALLDDGVILEAFYLSLNTMTLGGLRSRSAWWWMMPSSTWRTYCAARSADRHADISELFLGAS
jgi:hypothetical protein